MLALLTRRAVQSADDSRLFGFKSSFIFATPPFAVPQQEDLDTIFGTPQSRFVLSIVASSASGGQQELKRWETVCHTRNEQNRTINIMLKKLRNVSSPADFDTLTSSAARLGYYDRLWSVHH